MKEEWKEIENYVGKYEVSNHGRVRSLSQDNMRKNGRGQAIDGRILRYREYGLRGFSVQLRRGLFAKNNMLHDLVANAFLEKEPGRPYADHKDKNKENNHVNNLVWSSVEPELARVVEPINSEPFNITDKETGEKWRYVRWTNKAYQLSEKGKIRRVKVIEFKRERG